MYVYIYIYIYTYTYISICIYIYIYITRLGYINMPCYRRRYANIFKYDKYDLDKVMYNRCVHIYIYIYIHIIYIYMY